MWCFIVSEVKSIRSRVRNNVGDWKKIIFFMNIFRTGHLAAKKCLLLFKIARIKGTRALRSPGEWRLIGTSRDCAYGRVGYLWNKFSTYPFVFGTHIIQYSYNPPPVTSAIDPKGPYKVSRVNSHEACLNSFGFLLWLTATRVLWRERVKLLAKTAIFQLKSDDDKFTGRNGWGTLQCLFSTFYVLYIAYCLYLLCSLYCYCQVVEPLHSYIFGTLGFKIASFIIKGADMVACVYSVNLLFSSQPG